MKILLAEDTLDLNRTVTAALEYSGYEVTSTYDGDEAFQEIEKNGYDAIILDIMMPKKDGLTVLKELREHGVLTPVLMLTAKVEVDDRVAGLEAGADDYLTKPFALKELLARIKALTRRYSEYSGNDLAFGDLKLKGAEYEMSAENAVRLSVKEYQLLKVLILNQDHPLDTKYLKEHVWEDEPDAGEDTIFLYISYLRGKLASVASNAEISGEKGGEFQIVMKPQS